MARRSLLILIALAFFLTLGGLRSPAQQRPSSSSAIKYQVIATITPGQKTIVDGLTLLRFGVNFAGFGVNLILSENDHVIYCVNTDQGDFLFKDGHPLVYPGENILGSTVISHLGRYDNGSLVPLFNDVNENGDVLYMFWTTNGGREGLNGSDITPQLGSGNPKLTWWGESFFTTNGAAAVAVQTPGQNYYLVNGVLQKSAPKLNFLRLMETQAAKLWGTKPTGIYWDDLYHNVFPTTVFSANIRRYLNYVHRDLAYAGPGRFNEAGLTRNNSGKIAMILSLPNGAQAVVLITPGNVKPASLLLTKATTLDAQSVTVDYTIETASASAPIHFDIYRSPADDTAPAKQKIGSQDITAGDKDLSGKGALLPGKHTITLIPGTDLPPDTANPYVVVVATCNGSKTTTYFRKWLLGAISHGYDIMANHVWGPLRDKTVPEWETFMANTLHDKDGYDKVIPYNWENTCADPKSDMAVQAGYDLAAGYILKWMSIRNHHPGDVVDLHLIGHSRGSVVVVSALKYLFTVSPQFSGGYVELTLLDPHPASNVFGQWASFETASDGMLTKAALLPHGITMTFQSNANDRALEIPAGIKKIDVWYQHSKVTRFNKLPENTMNLWGLIDAIKNPNAIPIQWHDVSDYPPGSLQPIGHSEVPFYYDRRLLIQAL